MRNLNPMLNVGIVTDTNDQFLGSCFVFRYPGIFLTARHCVDQSRPDQLRVRLPARPGNGFAVNAITRHDIADIAVLDVAGVSEQDITWPQYQLFDDRAWGQDYMSCGYPQDYSACTPPTPRAFVGHIQRFFFHSSHLGYRYLAAELDTGCPRGLSGAPVFNPGFHGRLYGLITENIKTTTELESVLEVEEDGKTFREHYHNIINYGVALWLPAIAEWLDSAVPPLTQEELTRRAENQHRMAQGG